MVVWSVGFLVCLDWEMRSVSGVSMSALGGAVGGDLVRGIVKVEG